MAKEIRRQLGHTFKLLVGSDPSDTEVVNSRESLRRYLGSEPCTIAELEGGSGWIRGIMDDAFAEIASGCDVVIELRDGRT